MTEPTIDEMLAFVDSCIFNPRPAKDINDAMRHDEAAEIREAIRAILEQHRESEVDRFKAIVRLEEAAIIRAFVERVEKRIEQKYASWTGDHSQTAIEAMHDELAAMEKESQG
jgi:G3E family GTPase